MATTTGSRAGTTFPSTQPYSGAPAVAWGSASVASAPSVNDKFELCKIPYGAVVVGGSLYSSDMDTNGTPLLTGDIGYKLDDGTFVEAALGTGYALGVGGGNQTVKVAGAAFAGLAQIGTTTTVKGVTVYVRVTAAAATFAAGVVSAAIYYTMP